MFSVYAGILHRRAKSLEAARGALSLRESNEEGADVAAFCVRLMLVTQVWALTSASIDDH